MTPARFCSRTLNAKRLTNHQRRTKQVIIATWKLCPSARKNSYPNMFLKRQDLTAKTREFRQFAGNGNSLRMKGLMESSTVHMAGRKMIGKMKV
jgi:hypothetical protein